MRMLCVFLTLVFLAGCSGRQEEVEHAPKEGVTGEALSSVQEKTDIEEPAKKKQPESTTKPAPSGPETTAETLPEQSAGPQEKKDRPPQQSSGNLELVNVESSGFIGKKLSEMEPKLAEKFPENIGSISLRNVKWQILPGEVCSVFVGPDQRVWYVLRHPAMREDTESVMRIIEREFNKEAPQLIGARPALFEPGGRVWFIMDSGRILTGYDGRNWIKRSPSPDRRFRGNCPNHGRFYTHCYNLIVDGHLFFPDTKGAHCFDGKQWSYQQLVHGEIKWYEYLTLRAEPAGKGLIAVIPGKLTGLWRWRNGRWRRIRLELEDVRDIIPSHMDGVWVFTEKGNLHFVNFEEGSLEARFSELLSQLKVADNEKTRSRIAREMAQCGLIVEPLVKDALSKSYDHEVLKYLISVLEALKDPKDSSAPGGYQVQSAFLLHYDNVTCTAYIDARGVRKGEEQLGRGLLVVDGQGNSHFLAGEEFARGWNSGFTGDSGPLSATGGKAIWLPGRPGERPARMLDIEKGKFANSLPDRHFGWLHAVKTDGTVFAGTNRPTGGYSVAVYKPHAPDTRNVLKALPASVDRRDPIVFCVGSDGLVWADTGGKGIVRFDGKRWEPVSALHVRGKVNFFLPGCKGEMIIRMGGKYVYLSSKGVQEHENLKTLIKDCREEIVKSFAGYSGTDRYGYPRGIAADKSGNIWLLESRSLSVLIGDSWVSAKSALLTAGSRRGEVEYVSPVGDGSMVYLTDFSLRHDHGRSFFGKVKEGEILFSPAPHTTRLNFMRLSVRDHDGALWVPGNILHDGGTCDIIRGQLTHRITEAGVVQELKNSGWAKLYDKAGNIWLGRIRGKKNSLFNIWRDGKIVNTVTIPTADEYTRLFSDAPGSIFAWTPTGLYHMVSQAGSKVNFRLDKSYTVAGIPGVVSNIAYSKLGYLVVGSYSDLGGRKYHLHLVPLPRKRRK